jgi:hypothetical protein
MKKFIVVAVLFLLNIIYLSAAWAGFSGYLKADTVTNVTIGPVLAIANGYVPVTNLALSTADEAEIIKHNGTTVTSISAFTMTAITNADGYYYLALTEASTDTEGRITILIHDDSLCLPVRIDFEVVNANVYDSLYAVAATDYLQTDTLQLGGVTQSATDLKDFADAGYNPATDKVTGVLLTDTCTTNSDLVSAAAVVNEWESQSQTDPTGFHVNILEIGGTAQTANDNGSDINDILTDTGTTLNTLILDIPTVAEFEARSDVAGTAATPTEVATALTAIHLDHLLAVDYDPAAKPGTATALLNEIVESDAGVSRFTENSLEQAPSGTGASAATIADAVWDETQADHVGAGTFGITASEIADILVDTGTTLDTLVKDIPTVAEFEARSDLAGTATTPAEVATALTDIHLDHLLAVNYDPASKPGTATALLNEIIEDDAGISRFTENSLEQAPSGTGASAATIADAVWDEVLTGATHNVGSSGGKYIREMFDAGLYEEATAQAGGNDTITLAATASAIDDFYNMSTLTIIDGTGAGQMRTFKDYVGASKVATACMPWSVNPDATSKYVIKGHACVGVFQMQDGIYTLINAECDTALTDYDGPTKTEMDTAHGLLATEVKQDIIDTNVDSILTDTGTTLDTLVKDIPTNAEFEARSIVAADYVVVGDTIAGVTLCTTCTTNTDMVGTDNAATEAKQDIIDTNVDSVLTDTGTTLDTLIKDIPTIAEFEARSDVAGTAATPTEVNTEVSDVLKTDTISELSPGAPAATPTIEDALMLLYMKERNATQTTANEFRITNNAGTVLMEADIADNGTTFTKSKSRSVN